MRGLFWRSSFGPLLLLKRQNTVEQGHNVDGGHLQSQLEMHLHQVIVPIIQQQGKKPPAN